MDSGTGIGGHSKAFEEMTTSKLDLFSPIVIEKGVEKNHRIIYHPTTYSGEDGPIEYSIQPDPDKYIDIQTATLHGKARIQKKTNETWGNIANTDKVGLINNGFQGLFSTVVIKANDTEVGDTNPHSYCFSSFLQTLLGAKESCRETFLQQRQFMKETFPANDADDESFEYRNKMAKGGWMQFNIPIHNDLMTATRYLPPNTKLTFTFNRSTDNFCLHQKDDNEYRIELNTPHLSLVKYSVSEKILNHYYKTMKTTIPTIPYTKNVLKTYTVPSGNYDLSNHNLFFGKRLPERVYIMMVKQDAYSGNKKMSPYKFDFFNMKEACLMVNDVSEPSTPYTFDVSNDNTDLYYHFLENTGTSPFEMDSVWITFKEYIKGHFILAFDRSPTKDNGLYTHKMDGGHMGIRIHAKSALDENIQVLVYASYSSKMEFIEDKVKLEIP